MSSKNIIYLLFVITIAGALTFVFFNLLDQKTKAKTKKKVTFNEKIDLRTYNENDSIIPEELQTETNISDYDECGINGCILDDFEKDKNSSYSRPGYSNNDDSINNDYINGYYYASNNSEQIDEINNDTWDKNFVGPLVSDNERKRFTGKLHRNWKKYQQSLSDFWEHQIDGDVRIKSDITIDPYKHDTNPEELYGKTIGTIYDEKIGYYNNNLDKLKKMNDKKYINILSADSKINMYKSADIKDEFNKNINF